MDIKNNIDRLFLLISILTNNTTSDNTDDPSLDEQLHHFYSINRLHNITGIPKQYLREDLFHLSQLMTLSALAPDEIESCFNEADYTYFLKVNHNEDVYPDLVTLEQQFDLLDSLENVCDSSMNLKESIASQRKKLFLSGQIDQLPFHIESESIASSTDQINIALSRKEYDILDDFLTIHKITSVQDSASFSYDEKRIENTLDENIAKHISKKLKNLFTYISLGYDICFHYLKEVVVTHFLCLLFFPHNGSYYILGMKDATFALYDLSEIKTFNTADVFFKPCNTLPQMTKEDENLRDDFFKNILPHLWGPDYEKEPTIAEIDFYDDHEGRLFRKIDRVLSQYPLLTDEIVPVEDEVYHKGQIKKRHVRIMVYDRESFFDWIVMLGQSAVLLSPQDLRDRIISYNKKLLQLSDVSAGGN